ncbi:MAG: hypothetical protein JXR12_15100 [Neptunomonas phycophila]|uniref:hypothetical protein n=1 Tax=Neptunomonas phycophila TaxID=1572645 RepID=UPI003B8AE771
MSFLPIDFSKINNSNSSTGGGGNTQSGSTQGNCNVVQGLLGGAQKTKDTSLWGRAKDMFGSSIGQAAFKHVSGAIPKIEVDNNTNSHVRALADAVNSGAQSFAGSSTNDVMRSIYGGVGIDPGVVPANSNESTIFGNGEAAAGFLADKFIAGAIEEADLPAPIGALSAMAFVQQNKAQKPQDITDPGCGISPYARDLIAYAPKHNFMFMVQFEFQPDYNDLNLQRNKKLDKEETIKFHYLCREMERPTIEVEYDEVNMYNFRTKVAKKVNYSPINMKLVDDQKNSTMVFLEKYLKIRSPVANKDHQTSDFYEKEGMTWNGWDPTKVAEGSGSMGGLMGPNKSVLRRVVVYHIFGYGSRVNRYTYINPKIMEFNMSDFSQDNHEPAYVDLQMGYDSVFMETDIPEAETGVQQLQERSRLGTRQVLKHSGQSGE